jgi:exodeoxyribonuclease VII small subunit
LTAGALADTPNKKSTRGILEDRTMANEKSGAEIPSDIAALSFEDALAQLEGIVRSLEGGDSALDDAIAAYERGAALKQHCENKLRQAQARVEKISLGADGSPETTPADAG